MPGSDVEWSATFTYETSSFTRTSARVILNVIGQLVTPQQYRDVWLVSWQLLPPISWYVIGQLVSYLQYHYMWLASWQLLPPISWYVIGQLVSYLQYHYMWLVSW